MDASTDLEVKHVVCNNDIYANKYNYFFAGLNNLTGTLNLDKFKLFDNDPNNMLRGNVFYSMLPYTDDNLTIKFNNSDINYLYDSAFDTIYNDRGDDIDYKVIVDLKPLDGNENGVNVKIRDNVISINGELDKQTHRGEEILNFSQAYYLDEKLLTDKISKEKKGDKYIITIPFKD